MAFSKLGCSFSIGLTYVSVFVLLVAAVKFFVKLVVLWLESNLSFSSYLGPISESHFFAEVMNVETYLMLSLRASTETSSSYSYKSSSLISLSSERISISSEASSLLSSAMLDRMDLNASLWERLYYVIS